MKAISLHQPWSQLVVLGIKKLETRSWPCPPALIGERIAFHATKGEPDHLARVGEWTTHTSYYTDGLSQMRRLGCVENGELVPDGRERGLVVDLPLGAVVGSGRITASLPIVDSETTPCTTLEAHITVDNELWLYHDANLLPWPDRHVEDISDQLPYGDWSPGRYAWQIEDDAPTTERCPWCWGVDDHRDEPGVVWVCRVCKNAGRCDPIPARGHQRIWNWQP